MKSSMTWPLRCAASSPWCLPAWYRLLTRCMQPDAAADSGPSAALVDRGAKERSIAALKAAKEDPIVERAGILAGLRAGELREDECKVVAKQLEREMGRASAMPSKQRAAAQKVVQDRVVQNEAPPAHSALQSAEVVGGTRPVWPIYAPCAPT